jgi:hypothetical protein
LARKRKREDDSTVFGPGEVFPVGLSDQLATIGSATRVRTDGDARGIRHGKSPNRLKTTMHPVAAVSGRLGRIGAREWAGNRRFMSNDVCSMEGASWLKGNRRYKVHSAKGPLAGWLSGRRRF